MSDAQHQHQPHATPSHGVGHVVPPKILFATGGVLLVLTIVTVLAAKIEFDEAGVSELNILVALTIAVIKASLVVLFFMHLRWDRPFNSIVFVASIAFVALFIGFAMTDTFEYRQDIRSFAQTNLVAGNAEKVKAQLDTTAEQVSNDLASRARAGAAGAAADAPGH
jgi:cytochrome c oxidase subunit 4